MAPEIDRILIDLQKICCIGDTPQAVTGKALFQTLNNAFNTKKVPGVWNKSVIVTISKKGDPLETQTIAEASSCSKQPAS